MAHKVLRILALLLAAGTCLAEDAVVAKGTVMKADRSLVSLKAGTVVEVLGRTDKTASVLYKGQTGTVPLASLGGAAAKPVIADQPQSFYGNAVKKAEVNAAKHDDSLVKPANEVMDDTPPK
jgi:hypothetical protein